MNYYDFLDKILLWFYTAREVPSNKLEDIWDKNFKDDMTLNKFKILCEKLYSKEYITSESKNCDLDYYTITLSGILFYESGGYKKKKRKLCWLKFFNGIRSIGTFIGGIGIFCFTGIEAVSSWSHINDRKDDKSNIIERKEMNKITTLDTVKLNITKDTMK